MELNRWTTISLTNCSLVPNVSVLFLDVTRSTLNESERFLAKNFVQICHKFCAPKCRNHEQSFSADLLVCCLSLQFYKLYVRHLNLCILLKRVLRKRFKRDTHKSNNKGIERLCVVGVCCSFMFESTVLTGDVATLHESPTASAFDSEKQCSKGRLNLESCSVWDKSQNLRKSPKLWQGPSKTSVLKLTSVETGLASTVGSLHVVLLGQKNS